MRQDRSWIRGVSTKWLRDLKAMKNTEDIRDVEKELARRNKRRKKRAAKSPEKSIDSYAMRAQYGVETFPKDKPAVDHATVSV